MADLQRLFKRAFSAWPSFLSDSHAAAWKAWVRLTPEERLEAADRAPDYAAHCKAIASGACSFGVYLDQKRWESLPARADVAPEVDDYEPPFGPVWGAWRFIHLLTVEPAPSVSLDAKWPFVTALHRKAMLRQGHRFGPRARSLAVLMEPVPVDAARFEEWRADHERRGWPWLPSPGGMRVVYFPRGGPAALDDFDAAIKRGGHDGGERQAAE